MTKEAVAAEYGLTLEDIHAALAYVTELLDREHHYPLAG